MSYLGDHGYLPAINYPTITFMEKILTPESLVFETGTGNSTIWFARRAKRVVGFESRSEWFKEVQRFLKKEGLKNIKVYFDPGYAQKSFDEVLVEEDNIQYDVVLHDGPNPTAERLSLIKFIPSLVKSGGYLIVDDTDRDILVPAIKYLDSLSWEKTTIRGNDFFGEEKEAIVYRRPSKHFGDIPYLARNTLNFLESVVKKTDHILEFGSGGSTIWFAQHASSVVSFEHSLNWHKAIKKRLRELNLINVDLRFEPQYLWKGYSDGDEMFDFILVDSTVNFASYESRILCVKTSYLFLKPEGWLLLDDSRMDSCKKAVEFMRKLGWKTKAIDDTGPKLQNAQAWKKERIESG